MSALVSLPPMKKGTVNDELDADMMFEAARVCESGNTAAVLAEGMPPLLKDVGPDTCLLYYLTVIFIMESHRWGRKAAPSAG